MNKKLRKFLSLALVGMLTLTMSMPAMAAKTKDEAQQRIEELENEKKTLENKLSDLKANKTSTENYIEELDKQMTEVSTDIGDLNQQLEDLEVKIAETEVELEEAKEKEVKQYEVLRLRIKTMYEKGETSYLEILLNAKDISSILNNTEYISKISDFDNALLESLANTRQQIADYEEELAANKTEVEESKSKLEVKQDELASITDAKKAELSKLSANIDSAEGDLADVEEDLANENDILAHINAAEAKAQEEYEKIKDSISSGNSDSQGGGQESNNNNGGQTSDNDQTNGDGGNTEDTESSEESKDENKEESKDESNNSGNNGGNSGNSGNNGGNSGNGGGGISTGSGSFIWPLPGYSRISSNFGSRNCPFHGVEYHNGIDVPAPGGTPILAADSGVVVAASYDSSLGNYVIINHGNGYSTYYLHASRLNVRVGQNVSRGQVVSYVGTTGSSTGNHLDFRIRSGGGYVNPLNFVTPG